MNRPIFVAWTQYGNLLIKQEGDIDYQHNVGILCMRGQCIFSQY